MKVFNYRTRKEYNDEIAKVHGYNVLPIDKNKIVEEGTDSSSSEVKDMTFHKALFEEAPHDDDKNVGVLTEKTVSILILGCGNSRLGEDLLHYYIDFHVMKKSPIPKVIQCDISTHVVNDMNKRYHKYIEKEQMSIIQDDATQFTLIQDEMLDAVVDKGLVDALFCSDHYGLIQKVMKNVHRTLKVGKVFLFFSFSKPEYVLKHTKCKDDTNIAKYNPDTNVKSINKLEINRDERFKINWDSINVWELDDIYLYRFVKGANEEIHSPTMKIKKRR